MVNVKRESMKIYYSTPFSIDKNIGGAYNEFCKIVPNDEDWIVITDADSMFLTPDYGVIIHKAIQTHGNDFGLIGCYTNRLRKTHQLHNGTFSNDHDIRHHVKIAMEYMCKDGIEDITPLNIAGVFMAFQKKTWKLVGGFLENSIVADTFFSQQVVSKGLKLGLIRGLYVYHWYRGWEINNPFLSIKHLK
jgi:cellulose synthase/poly-beta-1,6-N-acetylglucosamine synthase-like glycosyltransferase